MSRRANLAETFVGAAGAVVIAAVLACARLWARLTRTPWYGD